MAEEGEKKSSIRIVDKRRFDEEGQDRGNIEQEGKEEGRNNTTRQETLEPQRVQGKQKGFVRESFEQVNKPFMEEDMTEETEMTGSEITFSSFVISLATQALMQLGQMKPPSGVEIPVDKISAKQTIDILEMLNQKTRGNLDEEEGRLIEEILHNLRISFVRTAG